MQEEFGAYLRSRRERVRPQEVGLSAAGARRTPGLRREEVAQLAAVSVDYVVRLEQGRLRPSESVLASLARALRLSAAEREALFALGRTPLGAARRAEGAGGAPARLEGPGGEAVLGDGGRVGSSLRPTLARIVEAVEPLPAYVLDATLDLLAWNSAAARLFGGLDGRPNIAWLVFTDAAYRARLVAPDQVEAEAAGALRLGLARDPGDDRLRALVEALVDASPAFAALWAAQDVRDKTHGRKAFTDPVAGAFELEWERLTVPGEAGLALMVYSAQPGSAAATALSRLGMLSSASV